VGVEVEEERIYGVERKMGREAEGDGGGERGRSVVGGGNRPENGSPAA
jgi:hypothetical protein